MTEEIYHNNHNENKTVSFCDENNSSDINENKRFSFLRKRTILT